MEAAIHTAEEALAARQAEVEAAAAAGHAALTAACVAMGRYASTVDRLYERGTAAGSQAQPLVGAMQPGHSRPLLATGIVSRTLPCRLLTLTLTSILVGRE